MLDSNSASGPLFLIVRSSYRPSFNGPQGAVCWEAMGRVEGRVSGPSRDRQGGGLQGSLALFVVVITIMILVTLLPLS